MGLCIVICLQRLTAVYQPVSLCKHVTMLGRIVLYTNPLVFVDMSLCSDALWIRIQDNASEHSDMFTKTNWLVYRTMRPSIVTCLQRLTMVRIQDNASQHSDMSTKTNWFVYKTMRPSIVTCLQRLTGSYTGQCVRA
jgi:hypothetical protein